MKINGNCNVRRLVLAATLSIGLGFGTHASAVDHSYLIDLKTGTATDLGSVTVKAINDAGRVVGYSTMADGRPHAFMTGPNGVGMTDINKQGSMYSSQATGINDSGQVVGYNATSLHEAFITGPNGVGITFLGTLSGGAWSEATDINNTGQVVGNAFPFGLMGGGSHAFITGTNGMGMTAISDGTLNEAAGINAAGRVVGWIETGPSQQGQAFITGPNGVGLTTLGSLGGNSGATDINDAGQVVGWADTATGQNHAFTTGPNGVGATDLGTLGGDQSKAFDINAAGQVVGWADTATGQQHAFIIGPNGVSMTDLNLLVHLPAGVVLTDAIAINNMGQVIASGVPEPQSYALMLAGLGVVGVMVRRKQKG